MNTTVENAKIERVIIGIEPDGTPVVQVLLVNHGAFKPEVADYKRTFCVSTYGNPRSSAEQIGQKIFTLSWSMDCCFDLSQLCGQVIRVEHQDGHILAISHAIQERWIAYSQSDIRIPKLVYPFYSGCPEPEPANAA